LATPSGLLFSGTKYENGTNRIGARRLRHISRILQVPTAFFFEGAPGVPAARTPKNAASPDAVMDSMASSERLALANAFMRIANMKVRRRIVDLVEKIVGAENDRG
jgi:hypothetical protein